MLTLNKIYLGDCLKIMKEISDQSVDMILTDPPYGVSRNSWDKRAPLDKMWSEFLRVIKPNGAIVITAVQPFSSMLVNSQLNIFRYDLVWVKSVASGQLNVNKRPLRKHEDILVFYKKQPTYNQQFTRGEPYEIHRKINFAGKGYNQQRESSKINTGYRHPTSVIYVPNPRIKGGHPTQKPVELFEYLIKTYTNKGDVVLDPFIGAGTTAIASIKAKRNYVGIEISKKYFDMALQNIKRMVTNF